MPDVMTEVDSHYRLDSAGRAALVENGSGWKLSLFLPLEKSSREAKVGSLLLRDLRREAEAELDARLIGHLERERLLAPIDDLLGGENHEHKDEFRELEPGDMPEDSGIAGLCRT